MSDDEFNIPKPPPFPKPKVNNTGEGSTGSEISKPSGLPKPPTVSKPAFPQNTRDVSKQNGGEAPTTSVPKSAPSSLPSPKPTVTPAVSQPDGANELPKPTFQQAAQPSEPADTRTVKPAASGSNFVLDEDEDYIPPAYTPEDKTVENTFQTSEPETDDEPGLFIPKSAEFDVSTEEYVPEAEVVEDYSPDYYDDSNVDYYGGKSNELVVSRGNFFGRIFKPLAWIGLASGLVAAGVFSAPYIADWFTETFTEQMTQTAPADSSEVTTEAIVEGEAENVPVTPVETPGEYDPEITFNIIGEVSNGQNVPQGSAAVVPYVNQPAGSQPSMLTIQLDTIERTEEFGPTLREVKIASVGDAVSQGVSQEEIEAQTENYRMSFVKITMQYNGEPESFSTQQAQISFNLGDLESSIANDTSQNVLAYYVNNLGYGIDEGRAEILEDHQCDISEEFPAEFWEGVPVQKCFITASNGPFDSVKYVNAGFETTLEYTYVE